MELLCTLAVQKKTEETAIRADREAAAHLDVSAENGHPIRQDILPSYLILGLRRAKARRRMENVSVRGLGTVAGDGRKERCGDAPLAFSLL